MRNNLKYYTFLFIFFIVVALGSLFILNGSGSVFDRSADTFGADEAVLNDIVIGTEAETAQIKEEAAEAEVIATEPEPEVQVVELPPEPEEAAAEEVTVQEPIELVEPETDTEEVKDEVPAEEEIVETEAETATELVETTAPGGVRYFTFKVSTNVNALRLREGTNIDSKIIDNLPKGSSGYVLKPANGWSKVYTEKGKTGYVSTDYIMVTEVTKDDFPKDILDQVEEPDDKLDSRFEGNG